MKENKITEVFIEIENFKTKRDDIDIQIKKKYQRLSFLVGEDYEICHLKKTENQ